MIKKLLLNGGKWETVEGIPPLTLEKSLGKDLKDYKLYGNSFQDGTPTPDTPVEVQSVGEYDEATGKYKVPVVVSGKNLFNVDTYQEPIKTNIYLTEPLRKVGEYADYVDFANGKVVRNINKKTISKSTTYIPSKQTNVCWFSASFSSAPHIADCIVLSKIFKPLQSNWWINDEGILSHKTSTGGFYFSLKWERLGLVYDKLNVYRVEDTEKTTPLTDTDLYDIVGEYFPKTFTADERTIYYPMETPVEELIELPQLPTLKSTTIISVNTLVAPSKMMVKYKRK